MSAPDRRMHLLLAASLGGLTMLMMAYWLLFMPHGAATGHHHLRGDTLPGPLDVWIIAGQSNAVGTNSMDGEPMPNVSSPDPSHVLMFTPDGSWATAKPNIHTGVHGFSDSYSVGPDMTFARALLVQNISKRVGLVPTAKGGSSLAEWKRGGALYGFMLDQARAALQLAPLAKLRGVVWVQGEADAVDEATANAYGSTFTSLVQAIRSDLSGHYKDSALPIVMAVMSTRLRNSLCPYIEVVRQQQEQLQLPGLVKVDMEGYEHYMEGFDGASGWLHFTKNGAAAYGTALAYAYMRFRQQHQATTLQLQQRPQRSVQQPQQTQQVQRLGRRLRKDADAPVVDSGTMAGTFILPGTLPQKQGQEQAQGSSGAAVSVNDDAATDIWILGGQSNCVGENMEDGQPIPPRSKPMGNSVLMYAADGQWKEAVPNIHMGYCGYKDQNSVGPDMSFARALVQSNFSKRVGLVPVACGATDLQAWRVDGPLYSHLVRHTSNGLASLVTRFPDARVRGMIWVQGETDANGNYTALEYGEKLKKIFRKIREDLLAPDLDIVMTVMATWDRSTVFPYIETVREQQQALQMPRLVKIDMEGYQFFAQQYLPGPRGPIHLTKGAQGAFGEAMAYQYMQHAVNQPKQRTGYDDR